MRSLLDQIFDRVEAGENVNVVWAGRPKVCEFPLFAASTAYLRGCRCVRCYERKVFNNPHHREPRYTWSARWSR